MSADAFFPDTRGNADAGDNVDGWYATFVVQYHRSMGTIWICLKIQMYSDFGILTDIYIYCGRVYPGSSRPSSLHVGMFSELLPPLGMANLTFHREP